jgi:hypothetical protein
MSSAARTFLSLYRDKMPRLAFLVTQGGNDDQKVLAKLGELAGRSDCPGIWLTTRDVRSGAAKSRIAAFGASLKL